MQNKQKTLNLKKKKKTKALPSDRLLSSATADSEPRHTLRISVTERERRHPWLGRRRRRGDRHLPLWPMQPATAILERPFTRIEQDPIRKPSKKKLRGKALRIRSVAWFKWRQTRFGFSSEGLGGLDFM